MALSYVQYVGNGSVQVFTVSFPYLEREHVKVYVDGVEDVGFTWDSDTQIRLSSIPEVDALVLIKRATPYDERSTDFVDASILDEETLDDAQNEIFYIVQEAVEAIENAMTLDPATNTWSANNITIGDVGDAVDPGDVITLGFLDSTYIPTMQTLLTNTQAARDASIVAQGLAEVAEDGAVVARGAAETARDATLGVQALVEAEGDTQVARVIAEGDTQDARVVAEGDAQLALIAATGINTKVSRTSSTGSAVIPSGTTAQQDGTPAAGYMRFNTDEGAFEGYDGSEWKGIGGGGGLEWVIGTASYTTETGVGTMLDTSGGSKTVTLHAAPEVGDTIAVADLKGTFALNSVTIDRNSMLIQGEAEDLLLDQKNQRVTLVYSGATDGWIITELEPNGSQFEYMPYAVMHVQDQKAQGTNGGTSVTGSNTRVLNTVLTNDISGASLASNQITLPAGEYWIEGSSAAYVSGAHKLRLYSVSSSTYLLEGKNSHNSPGAGYATTATDLAGKISITSTTVLELRHYMNNGWAAVGLGNPASQGTEVYADLKITKIGGNYAPKPIVSAARYEPMAGLSTTGGVMGFDISKTGANQLTVSKGVCLDSNLAVALTLTADTTLAIPAVANTIYHIFVVRLVASGLFSVRAYTSEAGVASDTEVDAFRWVGFWRTNGSSECVAALLVSGIFTFMKFSEATFISAYTVQATYQQLDASAHIPLSRAEEVMFDFQTTSTSTSQGMAMSVDGISTFWGSAVASTVSNGDGDVAAWERFGAPLSPVIGVGPFVTRSSNANNSTVKGAIHKVKLRR